MNRPAEKTGVAGAVSLLVGYAVGVRDPELLAAWGVVASMVPAGVTLVVSNGGLRGAARLLWRGRDRTAVVESKRKRS